MVEVLNSTLVMFVVCRVSLDKSIPTSMSGMCIGFAYFATTLSTNRKIGASVNPALSLPFAILNQEYETLALYLTAPFIGSLLGVFFYTIVEGEVSKPKVKSAEEGDNEAPVTAVKKDVPGVRQRLSQKNFSSNLVEEDEDDEMIREE